MAPQRPNHPRATHRLKYGSLEVGPFEAPWRRDIYIPDEPETGRSRIGESRMAAGPDDISPPHATYPTGYDSECSCCWLGISHTEERHAKCLNGER